MKQRQQQFLENLIYAIIWLLILLAPLFGYKERESLLWHHITHYWLKMAPFFALFLLNNYLLVPLLLWKKKWRQYVVFLTLGLVLFIIILPVLLGTGPPPFFEGHSPNHFEGPFGPPPDKLMLKMPVIVGPVINDLLVAILIIGFNLSIRFLFKSMRDERQIKILESHNLKAELDYLKVQVNPHFFMNTLNNIHALIDIDTEKAKDTVIELSKIMRYVLYDADHPLVPLSKEIQFLQHYTALMRIRFTDEVDIQTVFPETIKEGEIPPLLLITLLENAFKHGVSYRGGAFIHTTLSIADEKLYYKVSNSLVPKTSEKQGMGLDNLRKRLMLLYGDKYTLTIDRMETIYSATLVLPIAHSKNM